jgi:class 3 adenylate cyclase
MGVVYRAYDEKLQRPLAIKHLSDRTRPEAARRFRREAQTVARLNHPAIVQIYEIVETDRGDWIVMELVEGERLDSKIGSGELGVAQVVQLGRELAEGLAAAHAQGVIHRDLKASNVMVTKSGHVKILDFGIAKLIGEGDDSSLSKTGTVLGTCHAMSPEQIEGLHLDHRSDLFSLGSLLYEMLTGTSPFRSATTAETLARVCRLQQAPVRRTRPEVPQTLSDLVDSLLQKDPNRRPKSSADVASSLASLDGGVLAPGGAIRGVREHGADKSTQFEGIAGKRSRPDATPGSHPVAQSRSTSERRQLTVVCCGLAAVEEAGSASTLDPETIYETMLQLRILVQEVADRYAGHPGNVLGHRMLLYFGYPSAHEDDARRAVRAALDLIARTGQSQLASGPDLPIRLTLRIGIHTGTAVVATSPDVPEPITLGATLDSATELQALAEPGSVIVSPATFSLIQKGFVARALEPLMRLSGFPEPVVLHQVLSPLDSPDDSTTALAPLVGREQEVELLLSRFNLAREGSGQAVLISGEAGIGKSRLLLALRQHVDRGNASWLSCHASLYAQSSPLAPVIDLLRRILARQPGSTPQEQLLGLLRDQALAEALHFFALLLDLRFEDLPPAPSLSPERQREKTLEALVALPLAMAERQPLILVVEDLHWLDPSTLEWLDRLIDQAATVPLFLVLTFRLHSREISWRPRAHLTQITLGPLRNEEAERLVAQVLEERSLPQEIQRQIVARTDGVPLFIEELTRAVLESGESGERRELPATLRESLTARLDRLGTAKEIAQLASVVGRVFSLNLLTAVADRDENVLEREVQQLVQAGLVYRKGFGEQTRYLFKHALVQSAAYDSLLKRERQKIHRQIAETLASRFSDTAEAQPELLAQHYSEAGLPEPAIDNWLRAGQLASSRSASLEALSHLDRALQLLGSLPESPERDRRELKIQIALAAATIARGSFLDQAVARAYSRAEALAERLQETEERFWATQGLHTYHLMLGDFPRALVYADLLQRIATDSGSPTLLSIASCWIGLDHYYRADFVRALPELARAYELAPPEDASYLIRTGVDLRVLALSFQALVLWHLGHPERARSCGELAIALARDLGPFTLSFARGLSGAVLGHYLRDGDAVRREAREVYDLAVELGFHMWIWQATYLLAWVDLYAPTGDSPPFEPGAYGSPQAVEQVAGVSMDYYFCLYIEILLLQGRTGEALETLEHARSRCQEKGFLAWTGELDRIQGEILRSAGEPEEVERLFRASIDRARQCASRSLELRGALSLGRLWKDQGKSSEAHDLVAGVYRTFTEGFESHDLRQARDFLGSCSIEETT